MARPSHPSDPTRQGEPSDDKQHHPTASSHRRARPGTYRIDAARSAIAFTTRHLFGLGTVHGTFTLRDGEIHVADPVDESSARARISAASFWTGNTSRDSTVRSASLLDAGAHPDITFTSDRLDHADGSWILHGLLSVRGKARPVEVLVAGGLVPVRHPVRGPHARSVSGQRNRA